MLQQPARPSGNVQLPYTTADMAERLAKRKAAKDRQDILDSLSGGLSYGKSGIDLGSVAKSVGGFLKTAYENMPESIDTPVSSYGTGKSLITEPARLGVRRAAGDITAIPRVGEPSPSYSADKIRQQGVALGLLGAAIDYSQFIPVVAKGAGFASDAINASRIARMNRSPFPKIETPGAFLDVDALQGSRLPARIVDTPASPATRLAEAQTQRALPPAQVAPTVSNNQFPTLPQNVFGNEVWGNMPNAEAKAYAARGQEILDNLGKTPTIFDNGEYVILAHGGVSSDQLVGGVLDPSYIRERTLRGPQQTAVELMKENKQGRLPQNLVDELNASDEPGKLFATYVPVDRINTTYYSGQGPSGLHFIRVPKKDVYAGFGANGEVQVFGKHTPIASFQNQSPSQLLDVDSKLLSLGYLEDQLIKAQSLPTAPTTPATRLAEAQTQRALPPSAQRALPPAEITPGAIEPPASRLTSPAFRERPVPTSSRLTLEKLGINDTEDRIIIRSFNQETGEYTGAITISYKLATKEAVIDGLGATNPMVTPQLIAAAASEVRKLVGDVKYPLRPSVSLSRFSRPFVERLQQAGLIDPAYKLPKIDNINDIQKTSGPETFADENPYTTSTVIDPLSYTPGYNEVLKALVESRRQAKLAGEYGRLATPSNKLVDEEQITNGFDDAVPIPYREVPVSEYRNGISTGAQGFFIDEPKILAGLNNLELEKLIDDLRRDPSNPMDLIDIAKRNDPDYLTNIFAIPSYLHINNLIGSAENIILSREIIQRLMVDSRPARMAKFINDHIDPEWPELKRYLQRYGSVENFVNSREAFPLIRFLEPFFEWERNGL